MAMMMLALPTLSLQTTYPLIINNCGVKQTFAKPPERAVTMNQGMTEFLLAMGLEGSMAGTAYLDDAIWPRYEAQYKAIPVLAKKYPTDAQLMEVDADFITANYGSAFSEKPRRRSGSDSGVFTNMTVGPCDGEGSDYFKIYGTTNETNMAGSYGTCRPQLHAANIGTWLETTYCEDKGLRPGVATEQTVYDAVKEIGAIFNVNEVAKMLIDQIEADFDAAQTAVKNSGHALTAILLDGVGCGGDDEKLFVGAGEGSVNMILESAGMTNLFGDKEGSYACVTADEIIALNPEVLLLNEASWDTTLNKIDHLHNSSAWCAAPFVQRADYIKIPFSASALSPRNGAAAVDLVSVATHLLTGATTINLKSGVDAFDPNMLVSRTANLLCPLSLTDMKYSGVSAPPPAPDDSDDLPAWAIALIAVFCSLFVLVLAGACYMFAREKQGKPIFTEVTSEVAKA